MTTINKESVPWMRIHFSHIYLGKSSYIIITSLTDSSKQKLNAVSSVQWQNSSAYFNGGLVSVELYVAPGDEDVSFTIGEITVGERVKNQVTPQDLCGGDDRIASDDKAVGRLEDEGCTAWIASTGAIVTAGHCLTNPNSLRVLEFNVPASLPDGTIQHPPVKDQYPVDINSIVYVAGIDGNDWGVFAVGPNSETGLWPAIAQGRTIPIVNSYLPGSTRITGYGEDDATANYTQQTSTGGTLGLVGNYIRYVVDTRGGNSGSPVINVVSGNAFGVHTTASCASQGFNGGTSTLNTNFWNAINNVTVSITVQNGFGGGFVHVDGSDDPHKYNSPATFSWVTSGPTHSLLATSQDFSENGVNYFRAFRYWQILNDPLNIHDQTNPKIITPFSSAIYEAVFAKRCNISVQSPTFMESGSGGTYNITTPSGTSNGVSSWSGTAYDDESITITAVPPGPDWIVIEWVDDTGVKRYGNPLTFSPTYHISGLRAVFKKHLISTTSNASGYSNQKKLAMDLSTEIGLAYESAGKSFLTRSSDHTATWSTETFVTPSGEIRTPTICGNWYGGLITAWEEVLTTDGGITWTHKIVTDWGGVISSFTAAKTFYA